MKNEYEILKTIDATEDVIVIVAKKIKEEPKRCMNCEHMTSWGIIKSNGIKTSIGYCYKHKGIVEGNDVCIEVGM